MRSPIVAGAACLLLVISTAAACADFDRGEDPQAPDAGAEPEPEPEETTGGGEPDTAGGGDTTAGTSDADGPAEDATDAETEPVDPCGQLTPQELYDEECAFCHGDAFQGWEANPDALGPGLTGEGLKAWWFELTREGTAGRYGGAAMDGIPEFGVSDSDLDAALAYVVDGVEDGKGVWIQRCGSCHGNDGTAGGIGPAMAGGGLVDQWVEQIRLRFSPPDEPTMPPYEEMCEEDRRALAELLVNGPGG